MPENRHIKRISTLIMVVFVACMGIVYAYRSTSTYSAGEYQARVLPIYCVDTKDKKIAISFDASWGAQYTDKLLQILKDNDVKATFFLVGKWAEKYPDKVKLIDQEGHDIGNHSLTHPHFTAISPLKMKQELEATDSIIKGITGKNTKLFRAPFGDYNSEVVKEVNSLGYSFIQWDVDSIDWKNPGTDKMFRIVTGKVGPGSIVLFHNNADQTPLVLDSIIKTLKARGYSFVKIADLIYYSDYYIDHTGRQFRKPAN